MINNLYYLSVVLAGALFCILIVFLLKNPFFNLAKAAVKQLDLIFDAALDENEKDKLILKNLGKLLLNLFSTILLFLISIAISTIPVYIYVELTGAAADYSSFYFYLSLTIGSCVLFLFKFKKTTSDYNYWSKLLHTILLDNYNIGKFLFKKEAKKIEKQDTSSPSFVIVTGLARAGTTAFTNLIFEKTLFHSISYANMPFLMAPRLWRKIYNPKEGKLKERAHKDGVMVSFSSVEALEEYFFKTFLNDSYVGENSLTAHTIDKEVYEKYILYQEMFKKEPKTIYLAKNNNFMLRYESMREHNKDFKVILLFREPLAHARSLMRQHENFISSQKEDPFTLDYMNWLGHHEFGLNHKLFSFGENDSVPKHDIKSIDYWLEIWINYYSHILKYKDDNNICFVHHEDLAKAPGALKEKISSFTGIELPIVPDKKHEQKNYSSSDSTINDDLLKKAEEVYQRLQEVKLSIE